MKRILRCGKFVLSIRTIEMPPWNASKERFPGKGTMYTFTGCPFLIKFNIWDRWDRSTRKEEGR